MAKMNERQLIQLYYSYVAIPKEKRTKRQQLEMDYVEMAYSYISTRNGAIAMGNKEPDKNFIVKGYYEKMLKAHDELEAYVRG